MNLRFIMSLKGSYIIAKILSLLIKRGLKERQIIPQIAFIVKVIPLEIFLDHCELQNLRTV